jgi:hypothetical protein
MKNPKIVIGVGDLFSKVTYWDVDFIAAIFRINIYQK